MTAFGYTMMCEQSAPDRLVADVARAEQAGFDFSVDLDHYQPWLAGRAIAVRLVGARRRRAGDRADRPDDIRHVPDAALPPSGVQAQKAATMQILSGPVPPRPRPGENLNEHVVGKRIAESAGSPP